MWQDANNSNYIRAHIISFSYNPRPGILYI